MFLFCSCKQRPSTHAIIAYGGSLVGFYGSLDRRLFAFRYGGHADRAGARMARGASGTTSLLHRSALK